MAPTLKTSLLMAAMAVVLCISFELIGETSAARIDKRDVNDLKNDAEDAIDGLRGEGSHCFRNEDCSFIEFCEGIGKEGILNLDIQMQCKLRPWFIWGCVGIAAALLLSIIISCLCCPCCCLYAMCRKSS